MTLAPLLAAPPAVQIHVAAVLPAAILSIVLLTARKGTGAHKLFGRVWVGLMTIAALSSFFIHEIGGLYGFSAIHLLSVLTLAGLWAAIAKARAGDVAGHRRVMLQLNVGALGIAGGFTLLPGRRMAAVLFSGGHIWLVLAGLAMLTLAAALLLRRRLV
ncbi:hypothetical protein BJF93_11505 [Xaviernesmea oryzae]|uniref:DUF2306 domain-containing protein n=1 Tax=Xaviernesmea oryzae TaxID=464029 RepID=A0A1Q9AVB5_9HYPH|nr:DUF2306 domain-containing protein [Xaviernesmea oryzae]OLP59354.1 hypothetical protein BJF93_11505 [Xaviernesmea oryzae]SEL63451.1 LPXTG-motif cell wall anchor domain-containing protein [Xaviernesmea oryzae]